MVANPIALKNATLVTHTPISVALIDSLEAYLHASRRENAVMTYVVDEVRRKRNAYDSPLSSIKKRAICPIDWITRRVDLLDKIRTKPRKTKKE